MSELSSSNQRPKTFFHQAATCSVWLLLFPFLIQLVSAMAFARLSPEDARYPHLFVAAVIGLAMLAGVILGSVALFGIPKYGTKGILIKSLFGIIIPVLLVLLSIPVMIHAQERAARIRAMQETNAESGK